MADRILGGALPPPRSATGYEIAEQLSWRSTICANVVECVLSHANIMEKLEK